MKSQLAEAATRALQSDVRRMTAEQRLAAYATHCQLMIQLRLAGQAVRSRPAGSAPRDAR